MMDGVADRTSSEQLARAAREMQDQRDAATTMQAAVEVALRDIEGAEGVALSIVRNKGRVETLAWRPDPVLRGDELQYELSQGPCLEAVWQEPIVYSRDFSAEERWPHWAREMLRQTTYRSLMAFRLFTTAHVVGGLNLYSSQVDGFDAADRDLGLALAAHVAVAIRDAQLVDELQLALDSRTTTSTAVGIVMERFGIDQHKAFNTLVRISSQTNIKLRDLAAHLLQTGDLPAGHVDDGHA
jgi:GAF domain-containing protein